MTLSRMPTTARDSSSSTAAAGAREEIHSSMPPSRLWIASVALTNAAAAWDAALSSGSSRAVAVGFVTPSRVMASVINSRGASKAAEQWSGRLRGVTLQTVVSGARLRSSRP